MFRIRNEKVCRQSVELISRGLLRTSNNEQHKSFKIELPKELRNNMSMLEIRGLAHELRVAKIINANFLILHQK